jgi:hypothetical protein
MSENGERVFPTVLTVFTLSDRVCHEEKRGQRIAFAAREEKHKISRFGFCGGNVGNIRPKLVEVVLFVHPSFTCNAGYHWLSARES